MTVPSEVGGWQRTQVGEGNHPSVDSFTVRSCVTVVYQLLQKEKR